MGKTAEQIANEIYGTLSNFPYNGPGEEVKVVLAAAAIAGMRAEREAQRKAQETRLAKRSPEELAWDEIGNDARHGIGYGDIHRWVTRGVRAGIKAATRR
jgi:hypothetical protein